MGGGNGFNKLPVVKAVGIPGWARHQTLQYSENGVYKFENL